MSAASELDVWAVMNLSSAQANELWDIVGRIIAAERERCAKIADACSLQLVAYPSNECGEHYEAGVSDACDSIGAAIRAAENS